MTGASGHVGVNLVRRLTEKGDRVRALVYPSGDALRGLDAEIILGNVLDAGVLSGVFEKVEVVYHLAGVITLRWRRDERARRVNVEGTRNVVEACLSSRVGRLVHFSSIHALSAYPMEEPVDETRRLCSPEEKAPAYDHTKAEAERIVLAGSGLGLDAVIVNPTGILGPYDYAPSLMGGVMLGLMRGRLPVMFGGGFNWVDVRDVAAGAMAAAETGRTGERYILSGHYLTNREIAEEISAVTGVRPPRVFMPLSLARAMLPFSWGLEAIRGRPAALTRASLHALGHHQNVDGTKAMRELAYQPRPATETIRDTVEWFLSAGGRGVNGGTPGAFSG